MTKKRRHEVAASGGAAAHKKGTAHHWTPETAKLAARKSVAVRQKQQAAKAAE